MTDQQGTPGMTEERLAELHEWATELLATTLEYENGEPASFVDTRVFLETLDDIDRLRAENERLREAGNLALDILANWEHDDSYIDPDRVAVAVAMLVRSLRSLPVPEPTP